MMHRKHNYLKIQGLAILMWSVPWIVTAGELQQKPNFIQILTDDQGWGDLASFGHPFIKSPHIDRLAREGVKFTHCYSAAGVCSPSRAAILTGRTPYRTGVYRWVPPNHFCYLPAEEVTLPQLLRENGYQTAHFGKWHLSHYSEIPVPDSYYYETVNFGGELVGQPSMKEYGYDYWFATGNCARPNHKDPDNFFLNGEALGKIEGFSAQIVADQFAEWMREHRKEGEPFFTTVWFHEPHTHINSDPQFLERYNRLNDPSLRQYLANITQIDAAVGTIVKTLNEAGFYDNTMIWYTSDNGPDGQHEYGSFNQNDSPYGSSRCRGSTGGLRGRKRHTHEGGIRVPGIVSWPKGLRQAGVKSGQVCAEPIVGSDVFPTMLEVAGIPLPEGRKLDSTSILPLLLGQPFSRPRPLYWRNCLLERRIALRAGQWKIIGNSHRTEFELYNLRADPRETTDLSAHEPALFGSMKETLIEYDKEVLAEGPDWWRREETPENSTSPVPTQERLPTARSRNSAQRGNKP